MYCRVLACDFDGTGAVEGILTPEVAVAFQAARAEGVVTLLVTGRVLEDLAVAGFDATPFDAVVAENGAVVWLPARERRAVLGHPPPDSLLAALRQAGIPYRVGTVVVDTWHEHAAEVLELARRAALEVSLIFNRGALMVLPSGVGKVAGIRRALRELGRSEHDMVAFGDAENDTEMLDMAGVGVAARGAVPMVALRADEQLSRPSGEGVSSFVGRLRAAGWVLPTPSRHAVVLGTTDAGAEVRMPAMGASCLVSGDPRSGKSWLGGLVAERLLARDYRLCIVDPEGDHQELADRPDVLAFGNALPLPAAEQVALLLAEKPMSVVLDLTHHSQDAKVEYVRRLLPALVAQRRATGQPHWLVLDEAHYFLGHGAPGRGMLDALTVLLMTYRPSTLGSEVLQGVPMHLVMRTAVEEERYLLDSLLRSEAPDEPAVGTVLASLPPRRAVIFRRDTTPRLQLFTPGERATEHVHHARKYVDELLPAERGFWFTGTSPARVARSVSEFGAAVAEVPQATLQRHLVAGDFSRWALDVLGNDELAGGLHKLEATVRGGEPPNRAEIAALLRDQYGE